MTGRWLPALFLAAVFAVSSAVVAPRAATIDFDALMEEAGVALTPSDDLKEVRPPLTTLFNFEKAFRHKNVDMEVWYAIRPLARVEIKYEDPHSSAPNPDHIFPMVFQTMIGKLAKHGHTPSRVYEPKKARATFNADWAAASLFDTDPELGTVYPQGLLVAMHKNGKGDAYALFLFDDAKAVKPQLDELMGLLKFRP